MPDILNNIEELVGKDEKLIDIWGRRNPLFEKKYEQSVIRVISDYGVGASGNTGAKGKILGAGYEPYIMAFFFVFMDKFETFQPGFILAVIFLSRFSCSPAFEVITTSIPL